MVPREVALCQVHGGVGLVIQAVINLGRVAEVSAVLAVDHPIEAAVVAPFKEGARNGRHGLIRETVRLCQRKFSERARVYGLSLVFALPFNGSEAEEFVLPERSADGSPELLACVARVRGNRSVWVSWRSSDSSGTHFVSVQASVAEESEGRAVVAVGALFGDHVDGGAFRSSVDCRKPLCANHKFLDGFQGKLHNGSAYSVVLIVYSVYSHVDVATAVSVDGKNGVAVFCGVIGVGGFDSGSEVGKIGHVTPDHG